MCSLGMDRNGNNFGRTPEPRLSNESQNSKYSVDSANSYSETLNTGKNSGKLLDY